jgi:uncharacterized repeat protein (TIGR04042 family)
MRSLFHSFHLRKADGCSVLISQIMPEVIFTVQLPDGSTKECYSPSTVVQRYFVAGEEMPVAEFLVRSRTALTEATERVRQKFGFACSSASAQIAEIEQWTKLLPDDSTLRIVCI